MQSNIRKGLFPTIFSILGTLVALYPSNPDNMSLPSRDSGVFLYVGWRLLAGDVPYRDVWDHKPPLIYYADALGLAFSPGSLWGVWFLQFVFLFLTAFFLYKALDESLGVLPAIGGIVVLSSGLLTVLDRGNVTEEFALVFQTLAFWLFVKARKSKFPLTTTFWIGLCGGFAFYFKQTTIGLWIAYAVILLWIRVKDKRWPVGDMAVFLSGTLFLTIAISFGFAVQNALGDFWNQAFQYNFVYIGKHEGFSRLIPVFAKGFLYLSQGGVLYLAILGWLAGLAYLWIGRKRPAGPVELLVLLALIDFPVEVVLITISGRSILHYYLTPLPVMAILSGFVVYVIGLLVRRFPTISLLPLRSVVSSLGLIAILGLQIPLAFGYGIAVQNLAVNSYRPVIDYVREHTNPDDRVLVLGAESVVNFLARRQAPTRYVYQYPLQLLGRRDMFEEYFLEILQNQPTLLVDAPGSSPLDENLYKPMQPRSAIVRNGVHFLLENYRQVAVFGSWTVYRLKSSPP